MILCNSVGRVFLALNISSITRDEILVYIPQKCSSDIIPSSDISEYKFLRKLGSGGFGEAFLVLDIPNNCLLALKLYKKQTDDLQREIFFGNLLNCEHFITPLHQVAINEFIFNIQKNSTKAVNETFSPTYQPIGILYEWIPFNLYKFFHLPYVQEHKKKFLFLITYKLCEALHHIHSQNICHFDIKPANILVDVLFSKDGEVLHFTIKIIDFGLSSSLDQNHPYSIPKLKKLSRIGTDSYKAPELFFESSPDRITTAVDMWSLGQTLFALQWKGALFNSLTKKNMTEYYVLLVYWLYSSPSYFVFPRALPLFQPSQNIVPVLASSEILSKPSLNSLPLWQNSLAYEIKKRQELGVLLKSLIEDSNCRKKFFQETYGDEFYSVIIGFLSWDPQTRLNAPKALNRLQKIKGMWNMECES